MAVEGLRFGVGFRVAWLPVLRDRVLEPALEGVLLLREPGGEDVRVAMSRTLGDRHTSHRDHRLRVAAYWWNAAEPRAPRVGEPIGLGDPLQPGDAIFHGPPPVQGNFLPGLDRARRNS